MRTLARVVLCTVMPSCMAMGQAAGTAAAICADKSIPPRKADVAALRKSLIAQGASLG